MQHINDSITRDIESQRQSIDNKKTAIGMLEKLYGDKTAAQNIYRATELERIASQGRQIAAKNAGPLAQAQAQQRLAPLDIQKQQLLAQTAQLTAARKMLSQGQLPLHQAINILVPPNDQKAAKDELGKLQENQAAHTHADDLVDRMTKESQLANAASPESRMRMDALRAEMTATLQKATGMTRLSPQMENLMVKPLSPGYLKDAKTVDALRNALHKTIDIKAPTTSTLDSYGLTPQMPGKGFKRRSQ
jgi:hypothetical protein